MLAQLLLALLCAGLFCAATCPANSLGVVLDTQSKQVSSPYWFETDLSCDEGGTKKARVVRFTPEITGEYFVRVVTFFQSRPALAIEVRQGACGSEMLGCSSGPSEIGIQRLLLTGGSEYTVLVFPKASLAAYSDPDSVQVGLVCPVVRALLPTSLAQNFIFGSDSSTVGRLRCGAASAQTVHLASFTPTIGGFYSVRVAQVYANVSNPIGAMQILEGDCASTTTISCTTGLGSIGEDSIYLNPNQQYTIRLGVSFAYWQPASIVDGSVLTVNLVSLYSSGKNQTCTDVALLSTPQYQTATMSPQKTYTMRFSCSTAVANAAQYVSYTPQVTGDYYIKVRLPVSSTGEYVAVEVRAQACDGGTLACARFYRGQNDALKSQGLNSVPLTGNTTYVILVGSSYSSVVVEAGLVNLYAGESSSMCTDHGLISTPHYQTINMSNVFATEQDNDCRWSVTNAQYASFLPPVTGNYKISLVYTGDYAGVQVRAGSCDGHSVFCKDDFYIPFKGPGVVYLEAGKRYVMLAYPREYGSYFIENAKNGLSLEYCGNMCAALLGVKATGPFGTVSDVVRANQAAVVMPAVIFGLVMGLVLVLRICCCTRVNAELEGIASTGRFGASSLHRIRKLALGCGLLVVGVWVSGWAAFWSVLAYPVSMLVLVYAMVIFHKSRSAGEISSASETAVWVRKRLIWCGVLLALNALVALAQSAMQLTELTSFCAQYYPNNPACLASVWINPIYGLVSVVVMLALAFSAVVLGLVFQATADKARLLPRETWTIPMAEIALPVEFGIIVPVASEQIAVATQVTEEDELCQICMEARANQTLYRCKHRVCAACASKMKRKTCPFCNAAIVENNNRA
ncbi:hypothetical protein BASA81_012899 [Batrachochytrium salamandrivorans]|nr:hypothetical protein BASA81_012899 [Batrachochytrium salamandrivorans]